MLATSLDVLQRLIHGRGAIFNGYYLRGLNGTSMVRAKISLNRMGSNGRGPLASQSLLLEFLQASGLPLHET